MASHVPSEPKDVLLRAATILRDDAAYIRLQRQDYDAADPITHVENAKRLAALLEETAELSEAKLGGFIASHFTPADLGEIERIAGNIRGSSGGGTPDKDVRERLYQALHDAHSLLSRHISKSSTRRRAHN